MEAQDADTQQADTQDAPLTHALRDKVLEALERTIHLARMPSEAELDWSPAAGASPFTTLGHLLGHLLGCAGGFCSVFCRAFPEKLSHFAALQWLPANHRCGSAEAVDRLREYASLIDEGFNCCRDSSLSMIIPTVFVPQGETLLALILNNYEHLTNHKHQLFLCLRMLGKPLASRDLYRFHDPPAKR